MQKLKAYSKKCETCQLQKAIRLNVETFKFELIFFVVRLFVLGLCGHIRSACHHYIHIYGDQIRHSKEYFLQHFGIRLEFNVHCHFPECRLDSGCVSNDAWYENWNLFMGACSNSA